MTFDAEGGVISRYIDSNCGGPLELTSTTGASGRIKVYRETGCTGGASVTLERTGNDKMRFRYDPGNYAGNLTRE